MKLFVFLLFVALHSYTGLAQVKYFPTQYPHMLRPGDQPLPVCAMHKVSVPNANLPVWPSKPTKFGFPLTFDPTQQVRAYDIIGPADPNVDLTKYTLQGILGISGAALSDPTVPVGFLAMYNCPIVCPPGGCPYAEYESGVPEPGASLLHIAQALARDPALRVVSILPEAYPADENDAYYAPPWLVDRYWTEVVGYQVLLSTGLINPNLRFVIGESGGGMGFIVDAVGNQALGLQPITRPTLLSIVMDDWAAYMNGQGPNMGGSVPYNRPTLHLASQGVIMESGDFLLRHANQDVTNNAFLTFAKLNHPHMALGQYALYHISQNNATAPADFFWANATELWSYATKYTLQAIVNGVASRLRVPGTLSLLSREKLKHMCTRSADEIASGTIGNFTRSCWVQTKPGGNCPMTTQVLDAGVPMFDSSFDSASYARSTQLSFIGFSSSWWNPTNSAAYFCFNPDQEAVLECTDAQDEQMSPQGPNILTPCPVI